MDAAVTAENRPRVQTSSASTISGRASGWRSFWRGGVSHWLLLLFIGITSAVVDFWNLGGPSLWYDEVISADLSHLSVGVLWAYIWGSIPNMELYFLLLHNWVSALGALGIQPSEFMLRVPSALFGAMGALVLYQLGNRFFGGRFVGLLAALLYIFNQGQIAAAQQVRSYSMVVLFVCMLVYLFLEALLNAGRAENVRRSRLIWWGAFVLVASLALYIHVLSGLVLLSLGVLFLLLLILPGAWRSAARASFFWTTASMALVFLLGIPVMWVGRHGAYNDWVSPATIRTIGSWFYQLSNSEILYLAISVIVVVIGLLALVSRWTIAARGRGAFPEPGMLLLACWFLITAGIAYATTQQSINLHLFYPRYLIVVSPAWWLAIAVSLNQFRRVSSLVTMAATLAVILFALYALNGDVLVVALVLVLCAPLLMLYERYQRLALGFLFVLIALLGTPGYFADAAQQDVRTPYLWLQQHYQAGDGIICHPDYACSIAMDYYFWAYPGEARFDTNSPGVYRWYQGGYALHATAEGVQSYAAGHDRIFFISAPIINGISDASKHAITTWLRQSYTLSGQYSSTVGADYPRTVMVQLYVKKAAGP